jgi:putative nucleotidyltransferase with HDIG domain
MAGLLHDIGKVVLDRFVSATYPLFYRAAREQNETMRQTEARLFGMDHTEAGLALARRWAFPDAIAEVVRYHHHPEDPAVTHTDLVHVVYLAGLLMSRFRCDLELEHHHAERLDERLNRVGLSGSQLTDLVDLIPLAIFHDTLNLFGADNEN